MRNVSGRMIARFQIGFHLYEIFEMPPNSFADRYECWRDGSFIISDNYITDIGRALHFPGFLVDEIIAGFYDSEGSYNHD